MFNSQFFEHSKIDSNNNIRFEPKFEFVNFVENSFWLSCRLYKTDGKKLYDPSWQKPSKSALNKMK